MSFAKFLFFMPIENPRWPPPQDSGFGEEAWNVKSLQTTSDGNSSPGPLVQVQVNYIAKNRRGLNIN
jgi:hypothetical protein